MNIFQEMKKLQKIKDLILQEYCSEKELGKVISDCGNHIDLWFYDEYGDPLHGCTDLKDIIVAESGCAGFIGNFVNCDLSDLMQRLRGLGFEQSDHMLVYDFKSIKQGENLLLLDFKFLDIFEKEQS